MYVMDWLVVSLGFVVGLMMDVYVDKNKGDGGTGFILSPILFSFF